MLISSKNRKWIHENISDHVLIDEVLASAATDRTSADVTYRAKPASF